jgi:hypothetical protein
MQDSEAGVRKATREETAGEFAMAEDVRHLDRRA